MPQKDWKWFGYAGHLCVSANCLFHMTTQIGEYLISTVGAYYPGVRVKDGVAIQLVGERRIVGEPETVGHKRKFETYVFKVSGKCGCGCEMPKIALSEIDGEGCNSAKVATKNHMKFCLAYDELVNRGKSKK